MKKLVFRDKEFFADRIIKTENSIIFVVADKEVNRLHPLSSNINEYKIYNENGSIGHWDDVFHEEILTTGTDTMRLIYALLKENSKLEAQLGELEERMKNLEGGI